MSRWLAARLGYDPDRVSELPLEQQRALGLAALASLPGLALLSGAAGYGAYLASDLVAVALAVGVGAGLYLLNLQRVAVAGGGVGPQQPLAVVTHWMPRTVPLVMLALLGVFFAQPLVLAVLAKEQDPQVEDLRRALAAMHSQAVLRAVVEQRTRAEAAVDSAQAAVEQRRTTLEGRLAELANQAGAQGEGQKTLQRAVEDGRLELRAQADELDRARLTLQRLRKREAQTLAEDVEPYRRHLASAHFLLRRVQLTWERPLRPVLFSGLMVLLMVLPWFVSATVARRASRAYEAKRWKVNRALISAAYAEARSLEKEVLSHWPAFEGLRLELYEDAPYNTRARAGAGAFEARHG